MLNTFDSKLLLCSAHIFESAIGIGLNTFLTLESIQEVRPLVDIKVFGVDYVAESVSTANELLPALLPQVNASLGAICQGDSSDLGSFVPEDSMDLVFCGYIRCVPYYCSRSKHKIRIAIVAKTNPQSCSVPVLSSIHSILTMTTSPTFMTTFARQNVQIGVSELASLFLIVSYCTSALHSYFDPLLPVQKPKSWPKLLNRDKMTGLGIGWQRWFE